MHWLCHERFGDEMSSRMGVTIIVYSMGWMAIARMNIRRLGESQDAQQQLGLEKSAMASLLGMICDVSLWLATDADTIMRSDKRFDFILGRAMSGLSFCACIHEQQDGDLERVQAAFARAAQSPVLIPATLQFMSGHGVNVDLFIVKRHGDDVNSAGFLVGIRSSEQSYGKECVAEDFERMAPDQRAGLPDIDQELEAVSFDANGDAQTRITAPSPTVSTTMIGRVFVDLERALRADPNLDSDLRIRKRLEAVAELGVDEHWLFDAETVLLQPAKILGAGGFGVHQLATALLHAVSCHTFVNELIEFLGGESSWSRFVLPLSLIGAWIFFSL